MIKKKAIWYFLGLILFKILTDLIYQQIISVLFEYQNFEYSPSSFTSLLAWSVLLAYSPLIIKILNNKGLANSIVSVLILVSFIPTLTMIGSNSNYPTGYVILILLYWLLFLIAINAIPKIRFRIPQFLLKLNLISFILAILSLNVLYVSWKYTGFRLHFGLFNVYDIRAEARLYNFSALNGYLLTFADNILPLGLVYMLDKKKWMSAIVLFLVIYLNFSITATKQIFFLLLLAIIGYYFITSLRLSKYIFLGFLVLMTAGIIEYLIFDSYLISILSTYRVFFIPSKLHFVYYDFFSVNELDYFRQSFLKFITNSPYKENIGFLMGYHDIGDITARANNGLFSDAYFNMGLLGVFIFPFIVTFLIKLIEGASHGINERLLFIVVVSYSFVFLGLPFSTILFSGGLIPLTLFLYLIPREQTSS